MTPDPWSFALLALAAFRLYRLVARDTIAEPLRSALSYPDGDAVVLSDRPTIYEGRSSLGLSNTLGDDDRPKPLRVYASTLLRCHWCLGAYSSAAWWGAWMLWPHATLVVAVPAALSAAVALVSKNLDPA